MMQLVLSRTRVIPRCLGVGRTTKPSETEKSQHPSEKINDISDLYKPQCFPYFCKFYTSAKSKYKSIFYVKFQSKSTKESSPLGENIIKHYEV